MAELIPTAAQEHSVSGAAPFALMVTGLLMYWNRAFSRKRSPSAARSTTTIDAAVPSPVLRWKPS